jgi:hypothetical protein
VRLWKLLSGSAAALCVVPQVHAADLPVVEPEAARYVRVCDAYGSGWFYLPGTETCIRLDGDVRVHYQVAHYHDATAAEDETSFHEWRYRARLNARANTETEYGTLASRMRFVGASREGGHNDLLSSTEGPGSAAVTVDIATISLAGFQIGFDDSYWHRAGDFGYYEADLDGLYIEHNGIFAEYSFTAGDIAATFGVEDGEISGESGAPDLYAGLVLDGSPLYAAAIAYRDNSADAWAFKLRADLDLSPMLAGGGIGFYWMQDGGDTDYVKGHVWGVTAKAALGDRLTAFAGYSDYSDATGAGDSARNWTAGLAWSVAEGLLVQPEYTATTYSSESLGAGRRNGGAWRIKIARSF